MLDIRLDGNCFTASFSHDGVKRIVENKIQNILPKSKSEAKAGFGFYIQADSTIFITTDNSNKNYDRSERSQVFWIYDSNFNAIDSMSYSWIGMGRSPCYVRLPNDNYLFSDGNHNLIEFNSRGIIKK